MTRKRGLKSRIQIVSNWCPGWAQLHGEGSLEEAPEAKGPRAVTRATLLTATVP